MAKLNYSRQREAILDFLCHTTSHPTAEEVYRHIQDIYPNISLGTVYRNLSLLVEQGQALKIQGEYCDHFDGNTEPHPHFVCNKCKAVIDVEDNQNADDLESQLAEEGFKVENRFVIYYGICPKCSAEVH